MSFLTFLVSITRILIAGIFTVPTTGTQKDKKPKTFSPDTIEAGAKAPDTNS